MLFRRSLLIPLLLAAFALAQSSHQKAHKKAAMAASAHATSATKPVTRPKSFDLAAMDKSVSPCQDFYQYACGNWRKNNPIPADEARWGRFNELADYNRQILHQILQKDSANNPKRTPVQQKIGDMYESCMDVKAVNAKGAAPIKPELERIAAITNKEQLMSTVAYLQNLGVPALFGFRSQPDMHNASMEMAAIFQGGLGLPDREYYLAQDDKSKETRAKYLEHVAEMFKLLGDSPDTAAKEAQTVVDVETKLAEPALERVQMRNPKNRDHKMAVSELEKLAPNFEFTKFFSDTGAPSFTEVNVVPPEFFEKVNAVIDSVPIADWKTYLRWHVVNSAAPFLSDNFVNANFDFFGKYLSGQKELQPRWKRCVQTTDRLLGEALGQPYVDETFGPQGKKRMLKMVQALEAALGDDIHNVDWMTPETKTKAEEKLKAISNKIGYPDKWRNYSTVKITRDDLVGDVQRARGFEVHRNWNKIGKPLDKKEWGMSPPTVNAYYSASNNDINFPAGILQPPFFDKNADEAVNFGGIGVVIGHELTHGFDDQGSKFDAEGNFSNWWTEADRKEFDKRTGCIADEYSKFSPVEGVNLNGRLTLGENTADNGGIHIALMALRKRIAQDPKLERSIAGFTPDQRFFIGFAQIWCENRTDASSRLLAKIDPHSPGKFRVIGTVQNDADFAKAFHCKPGDKMVSENACHVW